MPDSDSIDWLANKTGGRIDFRLDGDPRVIPDDVLESRRDAYLRQVRAQINAETMARYAALGLADCDLRGVRHDPCRWRDYFGVLEGDDND